VIIVEIISQTIMPEAKNGMYSEGCCFQSPVPTVPIIAIRIARLTVLQKGPITVRRYRRLISIKAMRPHKS
jgi:hypothetical protein